MILFSKSYRFSCCYYAAVTTYVWETLVSVFLYTMSYNKLFVFFIFYMCFDQCYQNYQRIYCDISSNFPSPYIVLDKLCKILSQGSYVSDNRNFEYHISNVEISFYNALQITLFSCGIT